MKYYQKLMVQEWEIDILQRKLEIIELEYI